MEQSQALDVMLSGKNCVLTGEAGTGKTFVTKQFVKKMRDMGKFVVVVAPTGIAAINIEGATIHSTFKMFGNYLAYRMPKQQNVEWKKVDSIVFDEISMVGPDYLDYCEYVLRVETEKNIPFGGIQVIVVGDPKQLPPVYGSYTEQDKKDLEGLKKKYGPRLTYDKAKCFKDFEMLELSVPQRQKDPEFVKLLNQIRVGNLGYLRKFQQGTGTEHSVHLMPTNAMVDSFNGRQYAKLEGKEEVYHAYVDGKFNVESCITPETLRLKPGARIMVTKNMSFGPLVNGDLGDVVQCGAGEVLIFSDRLKQNVVIQQEEWKQIEYVG